jgi:hypothetical protein
MNKKNTAKKANTATTAAEQSKAPASAAVTAATIALCVLVTLPPKEKFDAGKGYWQIEIKDQQGQRYSDVYRTKDLEKAHTLAEKIAKDRKLPIVTQEPPAPRAKASEPAAVAEPVPMPDPEDYDADGTPF